MADELNPNIPLNPPREWFSPPAEMPKDAGCVVEQNGRVYGYLCHWGSVLFDGTNDRWTPPRTKSGYAFAHTGDTICDDGSTIKTANLGGDFGHAPQADHGDVERLQSFYENTQTQLARVRYGEDDHGVWFAGVCWPTVNDFDIAKMRASARSGHWCAVGDWRDIHSGRVGYELVGACLVNVPGLKYARADRAASGVFTLTPLADQSMKPAGGFYIDEGGFVRFNAEGAPPMVATAASPMQHRVASQGSVTLQQDEVIGAVTDNPVAVGGVLVVEGVKTEDGRLIEEGATEWRDLPLPLYSSLANLPGHDSAALVGTINEIWRDESDKKRMHWKGYITPSLSDGAGKATVEAISAEALRGVSIDGSGGPDDMYVDADETLRFTRMIVLGATLTPMPAIAEASVTLLSSDRKDLSMADDTTTDLAVDEETDDAVEDATEETADDDRLSAIEDKLDALTEAVTNLVNAVEASQMAARYQAAIQRVEGK